VLRSTQEIWGGRIEVVCCGIAATREQKNDIAERVDRDRKAENSEALDVVGRGSRREERYERERQFYEGVVR
jgi:hypothetical protein